MAREERQLLLIIQLPEEQPEYRHVEILWKYRLKPVAQGCFSGRETHQRISLRVQIRYAAGMPAALRAAPEAMSLPSGAPLLTMSAPLQQGKGVMYFRNAADFEMLAVRLRKYIMTVMPGPAPVLP